MQRFLLDTSIYVAYLRDGDAAEVIRTTVGRGLVHLSVVVVQELLVGALSDPTRRFLLELADRFQAIGRLEVPTRSDWMRAGQAIGQVALRHGFETVRRARLTNDALIAASAQRIGAVVITANPADFEILQDYIRVTVLPGSA